MVQPADIELNAAAYMVLPGSYRRESDGVAEGRTGRVVVKDFFGGQRRALQLERDKGWDSLGVGPALFGQAVEPWPHTESFDDTTNKTATTVRIPSTIRLNTGYVAIGQYLLTSVGLTAASWGSYTQIYDAGAGITITALGLSGADDRVAIAHGAGLEIKLTNSVGTITAFRGGGHFATRLVGYANQLIWADATAGNAHLLKLSTGSSAPGPAVVSIELDSPIQQIALHGGEVAIATRTSLYLLGGRADPGKVDDAAITGDQSIAAHWTQEPRGVFTGGVWTDDEDFLFLLSFGGKLYTWLGNQLVEWTDAGDRQGWRATGIEGQSCHGATVAGSYLVVAITTRWGAFQTWAFDGAGWWLIEESATIQRVWPTYTGGAGNLDVVCFRADDATFTYDLYRLVHRHTSANSYRPAGAYTTSLLDAGERDKQKAWRKLGATFTSPELRGNPASNDSVTLTLAYSTNGGESFTTAGSLAVNDPTDRQTEIDASLLSAVAASKTIQLRMAWSSVLDWAPVLTSLWAEYVLLDAPGRRRRWTMKVQARDAEVQRDGSVDARSGRAIAADLWAAWELNLTVPLRDLDFDVTGATYSVRVVSIREEVAKPADGARWGHSTLTLTLLEV